MSTSTKKHLFAFAAAVTLTAILASLCSTQFVVGGLTALGIEIPLARRIGMSFEDLGILQSLLPAIAASWLVGFPVAHALAGRIGGNRHAWFAAAGGAALVAELLIIQSVLGVTPIAGARSTAGLLCQGLVGAIGGFLFARMTRAPHLKDDLDA